MDLFGIIILLGLIGAYTVGRLHEQARQAARREKPTGVPTSAVQRRSHHIDVQAVPYKIPPLHERVNLLEPIDIQAANKRNRDRALAPYRRH